MPYRVAGRPHLETTRPQGTADELFAGKIDVQDLKPGVLSGLERVMTQLRRQLQIFSGYRTDAYSEHVGGFAGDPHTRRIAVDADSGGTPIGNVPRAKRLLEDAGFISGAQPNFYHGQPDPSHVQLRNEAGSGGDGQPPGQQNITLSQLWIRAGGKPAKANIMAAIALAESGGRVDAVGGPNDDGTYDYGLWQINSSHHYNRRRLLHNPLYNAHAAVNIERTQGLTAWSVYNSGAYRSHMGETGPQIPVGGGSGATRSRPGGQNADQGAADTKNQQVEFHNYLNPGNPFERIFPGLGPAGDLLHLFHIPGISDVNSFFKWIAWTFHPRNILRIVEFLTGVGLFALGLAASMKVFGEAGAGIASVAGKAAEATPVGRSARTAVQARRAARTGRSEGRAQVRRAKVSDARKAARKRAKTEEGNREFKRKAKRTPADDIPF